MAKYSQKNRHKGAFLGFAGLSIYFPFMFGNQL